MHIIVVVILCFQLKACVGQNDLRDLSDKSVSAKDILLTDIDDLGLAYTDDIKLTSRATTQSNGNTIISEKEKLDKDSAVDWLLSDVKKIDTEREPYNGWYNNPSQPSLGSVDSTLIRLLPSAYEDGVEKPVKRKKEANPLHISDKIMEELSACRNCSMACSKTGKNVLMVFFGQFVVEDILYAQKPSCPPDHFNIEIPSDHYYKKTKLKEMPFIRTQYDKQTGTSPNNPREQLNSATLWIDGSVIYGTSKAWSDALRSFEYGQLSSNKDHEHFPAPNNDYLSFANPSLGINGTLQKKNNFKIGNPLGHENPFILTFSILFFRWHNLLAKKICQKDKSWKDEDCFNEARKWVIATLQHIIVDEWLPELLGEKLEDYKRYDPSVHPGISHAFQSAAMRFGHTLIPSVIYNRTTYDECKNSEIRLCNSFYNAQDMLIKNDIDSLLLGMAFQSAENDDRAVVNDIRRYLYGPPEFTRRDLMALNIQRGRDHGLPGYGIARKLLLPEENITSFSFQTLAKMSDPAYKHIIENTLQDFYSSVDDVDLWVGGLLEANAGPGPVFKNIITEQFQRIRDGDRFWFENKDNGFFTDSQIQRIKSIRLYDIIVSVAKHIGFNDLQKEIFHLPLDSKELENLNCAKQLESYVCHRFGSDKTCYSLPPPTKATNCSQPQQLKCIGAEPKTYDYFTGSGAWLIISFLFLFLFIVGCIITLVVLVRRRQEEVTINLQSAKHQKKLPPGQNGVVVTEWISKKVGTRQVIVVFNVERKHVIISLASGQALRSIDLSIATMIELQVSTGGNDYHIVVRIAREYDMVFKFDTEKEMDLFIEELEVFLGAIGVGRQRHEMTVANMLKGAVTKKVRQKQLEKFFRVVFAQAFSIEHDQDELLNIDSTQAREIINTELTPYEFAEALSLRSDALFVKQMFALVDADGNGYISFREFLNMIIIFAKGSPEDKTKLMFDMYDIDHSGKLTRHEFSGMIRSLLELANQSLSSDQLDHLITSMFKSAGLQNKPEITFEDFSHLLADHREELGYVQLSFDIGEGYKTGPTGPGANRRSAAIRAQEAVLRAYGTVGGDRAQRQERRKTHVRMETKQATYEVDVTKQKVNKVIRFIENYQYHIFWATLYTLIVFGIFIQKAYYYSVESEHTGLRRVAGYGLTVTRGAASVMMFTFSTILLTMCRNIITFLRETFFHKYIPFDAAIMLHKYIACWALIFTVMHAIGHGINFYHISTQTPSDLQCYFSAFHLVPEKPPKFQYWLFQTITGITGVFLVIIMSLMYVFAMQYARRHVFNTFWHTHNLYPLLYILMILHGTGHLIQEPIFYCYFIGPCVLFTIDRLISVSRKQVEIAVVKAELLPSGVTHLEFKRPANFEYRSGQWVRIACVPLNSNEYHPFTLSSAPHEENLSLHIRAVGPWTSNLRSVYDPNNLHQHAYPKIHLDGPYGEGHQDWFRYEVSVLVGGGIGITPFASILKDVAFKASLKTQIVCKKLYFIWVTRTQKHFEWMTDIIQEVEECDKKGLVDVHIFITQFYQKFDLRTTMLYICERHFQRVSGRSLFTGLRATTHFGRPDFNIFFESLQHEHPNVNKIAVFSCGPPLMTHGVQLSCDELNKHEGAIFVHHFENF